MVNSIRVLFCALACFFSITVYANDPIRKNFNKHVKNQEAYQMHTQRAAANVIADIKMGAPDSPQRTSVKQMLDRSGVLEDGSKVKIGASVTRPVDTAKAASTLAERFKNAGNYAKKLGKASLPGFLGSAAFYGLMEGVDYVMDPENNTIVKKESVGVNDAKTENTTGKYTSQYRYYIRTAGQRLYAYSVEDTCKLFVDYKNTLNDGKIYQFSRLNATTGCYYHARGVGGGGSFDNTISPGKETNPNYGGTAQNIPATQQEIEDAIKRALEANNAAQAAAIAEALKAAYTQDNSEGQPKTTNPLIAEIQDDMQSAVDGALDNPTTSGGTAERPSGHYKITDGEKTIEGYVTPSDTSGQTNTDTESNTVTDPITGNQTTTGTSTGSIQFPPFCDWAGIVCEWIGWTKEEPEEPQIEPPVIEQIDIPFVPFSITQFNATCPADQQLSLDLMGTNQSFVLPMTPFCDFFSSIKPFVIALASFFAVKLIGNGAFNSGN